MKAEELREHMIFDWGEKSWTKADFQSIISVARGEATGEQQKRCMQLIISYLSRADDLPYVPDSADQSAFMAGRQFVGKKLKMLQNYKIGELEEKGDERRG